MIGTTSEPVMANSSTTIASRVTATAAGSADRIRPSRSVSTAASPVTQDGPPGGRSARNRSHQVPDRGRLRVPDDVELHRPPHRRPAGAPGDPSHRRVGGEAGRPALQRRRRRLRATTVIAGAAGRPNRSASVSATRAASMLRGTPSMPGSRTEEDTSGAPAASRAAPVHDGDQDGAALDHRGQAGRTTPRSACAVVSARVTAARWRRLGRTQRLSSPIRAAVKVSEATMATMAIETPAAPSAVSVGRSNSSRPLSAAATVSALNPMVRPAVAQARAIATSGVPAVHQLLPVAGDQQQPVVHGQAEPEQRHDGDAVLVDVGDEREAEQDAHRRGDRERGGEHRQPGRDDAAEHDEQHHESDAAAR